MPLKIRGNAYCVVRNFEGLGQKRKNYSSKYFFYIPYENGGSKNGY